MEKLKPRPYQVGAVRKAWGRTSRGKRVLVSAPGGSGKTVMIALMVKRAHGKRMRALVVAHRRELLDQARTHLLRIGVPGTCIGLVGAPVQVLSVLVARRKATPVDIIFIDEAHRACATSYREIIRANPRARVVGFTATPTRLDGKALKGVFDELITVSSIPRLVKKGLLSRPMCFTDKEALLPNLLNLRKAQGDYAFTQLFGRVSPRRIVGGMVENYKKHGGGERALLFAVNRRHAALCAETFIKEGVPAGYVDGKMPLRQRESAIDAFRSGRTRVLCNCLLLGEGFDVPDCRVVIMAAPTLSYVKFQQQAARAMRPHRRRAVLLDHARNIARHWLPYIERKFTLDGGLEKGDPSCKPKTCPLCYAIVSALAVLCENCGHVFVKKERTLPKELTRELTEVGRAKSEIMDRVREYAKKNKCPAFVRRVEAAFKRGESLIASAFQQRELDD